MREASGSSSAAASSTSPAARDRATAFVYDARTGELLDRSTSAARFVNDVTVTREAAYFTDSRRHKLFIYRYDRRHRRESTAIPISGDLVYGPGFNANGIAATPTARR